jgi:galactoside O-acetyltransferase
MNTDLIQHEEGKGLFNLRQPIWKTAGMIAERQWIKLMVRLSDMSPFFMRLAELPLDPYKGRRKLFRYLGDRSYVSPKAQIVCPILELGPRCFIDDYVTIFAHPSARCGVHLEENVHIYRWTVIELAQGKGCLKIGRNTYIQPGGVLNALVGSIIIGANCMIAARCSFVPYQHGFANLERPMREQPFTSRGDIIIEDDVWLGLNVCVMDGVTIGQGSIVGAGAVVTKDIPPYSIAGGVPARVIRARKAEDVPRVAAGEVVY